MHYAYLPLIRIITYYGEKGFPFLKTDIPEHKNAKAALTVATTGTVEPYATGYSTWIRAAYMRMEVRNRYLTAPSASFSLQISNRRQSRY